MTQDANLPKPSPAELDILRVLWRLGPCTVRQVHEELKAVRDGGYYTYLKLLQIMAQKGLARRNESQRAHIYEAAVSEKATERQLVMDLLERGFGGSARRLVMRALEARTITPEELAEIRELMDAIEEGEP